MSNNKYIDILEFSNDPWGRSVEDNPDSNGNDFRKRFLTDAFRTADKVTVDFSKLRDVPDSAFLGGSFVNLIKEDGFSYDEVLQKLVILPADGFLPQLVRRIIELARDEHKRVAGA
ncbi:DUF4325 domain-containing protein [Neisseria meningitidis]|uniref:STAS-like domain-containing protein n=1 Tax=Neisseria TaxID=482 RepID=UPI000E59335F|nr:MULTISPECIES: DUF4325 domain-containing protein [Neisseria]MBH2056315.1 DUF4325 domain-containing protein [Neisseria meningitidis]MBH2061443.1 DUF4325 domain-containing protein [Neisseria meningitidis]MBH2080537.1 DUF4325 domain-containing protein [Neisseria meningitidis]MBH2162130.1 DUF4325 domain-containing protein [Neisseria meningitidis]MBH2281373.1 DUF4325 domain-containing protein [Neisseria meningitidis]